MVSQLCESCFSSLHTSLQIEKLKVEQTWLEQRAQHAELQKNQLQEQVSEMQSMCSDASMDGARLLQELLKLRALAGQVNSFWHTLHQPLPKTKEQPGSSLRSFLALLGNAGGGCTKCWPVQNAHVLDGRWVTEQAQLHASRKRLRQLLRREQGSSEGCSLGSLPPREAGPEAAADLESAGKTLYAASLVTRPINANFQVTHVTGALAAQSTA